MGSLGHSHDTVEAVSQWASPCPCGDLPLPKLEQNQLHSHQWPSGEGRDIELPRCPSGAGGPRGEGGPGPGAWRAVPGSSGAPCLAEGKAAAVILRGNPALRPLAVTLVLPERF